MHTKHDVDEWNYRKTINNKYNYFEPRPCMQRLKCANNQHNAENYVLSYRFYAFHSDDA